MIFCCLLEWASVIDRSSRASERHIKDQRSCDKLSEESWMLWTSSRDSEGSSGAITNLQRLLVWYLFLWAKFCQTFCNDWVLRDEDEEYFKFQVSFYWNERKKMQNIILCRETKQWDLSGSPFVRKFSWFVPAHTAQMSRREKATKGFSMPRPTFRACWKRWDERINRYYRRILPSIHKITFNSFYYD